MEKEKVPDIYVQEASHLYDWETYAMLQKKCSATTDNFTGETMEYALDRLLNRPQRKATAEQLAKDLVSEGRKRLKKFRTHISVHREVLPDEVRNLRVTEEVPTMRLGEVLVIIQSFFSSLTRKQLTTLQLWLDEEGFNENIISLSLGVSLRQFYNIKKSIHNRIMKDERLKTAFQLAIEHFMFSKADFMALIPGGSL
ncbi:hypothetical protein [Mucilaginibacter jinjuensis]|uniref:Uncharacterized protein n=1 Tax=Mucilaginibacter jinjuensis TaxID=1176721 RepID=A0ABY7TB68_9SPHI|nr:hypothetical protein [Mucilaginibacter jinjuensis]WCT13474.1 hypothetical protein PQO05_05940 [Mucilaginibacter jinjuensis]